MGCVLGSWAKFNKKDLKLNLLRLFNISVQEDELSLNDPTSLSFWYEGSYAEIAVSFDIESQSEALLPLCKTEKEEAKSLIALMVSSEDELSSEKNFAALNLFTKLVCATCELDSSTLYIEGVFSHKAKNLSRLILEDINAKRAPLGFFFKVIGEKNIATTLGLTNFGLPEICTEVSDEKKASKLSFLANFLALNSYKLNDGDELQYSSFLTDEPALLKVEKLADNLIFLRQAK